MWSDRCFWFYTYTCVTHFAVVLNCCVCFMSVIYPAVLAQHIHPQYILSNSLTGISEAAMCIIQTGTNASGLPMGTIRYLITQQQWAQGWCPGKSSFLALSWSWVKPLGEIDKISSMSTILVHTPQPCLCQVLTHEIKLLCPRKEYISYHAVSSWHCLDNFHLSCFSPFYIPSTPQYLLLSRSRLCCLKRRRNNLFDLYIHISLSLSDQDVRPKLIALVKSMWTYR